MIDVWKKTLLPTRLDDDLIASGVGGGGANFGGFGNAIVGAGVSQGKEGGIFIGVFASFF